MALRECLRTRSPHSVTRCVGGCAKPDHCTPGFHGPNAIISPIQRRFGVFVMKNLFERESVDEVITRIDKLQPTAPRQWGKMDVAQMLAHCSAAMDMAAGRITPPRMLIGRFLGPLVKPIYTNEKPFGQGNPTEKTLVVSDTREFSLERERLKRCVQEFLAGGEARCTRHPHPFFGALKPSEWARGMYKHLDHHLRQFGA